MADKKWPENWQDVTPGCMVFRPASARDYHTGSWRAKRPIWENEKCIKCGVCWVFCPDAAIYKNEEGHFLANLDYCKGCGICARECWTGCITMVEEEK